MAIRASLAFARLAPLGAALAAAAHLVAHVLGIPHAGW
jgi:hypothetical protein